MSKKPNQPDPLRTKVEAQLAHAPPTDGSPRPAEELLHELRVHQIELEMQNDELRRAQITLEESRDRYADLYDFAPVGYLTLTREALITGMNLTGAALLGVERNKLLHRRFAQLVAPEDSDRWHQYFMRVVQQGERQGCELALKRGDGSVFHAHLECLHLKKEGENTVVRIAFTDITGRKKAEGELRLRAQLLDSISDTIFLLDLNGNFVYLNEAAWKTRGYTRDEMMGMDLHVLDTPKYEKLIESRIREVMEKGQSIFESEQRRKDGSVMPVEINARTIELDGHKRLLSIIRDITERKRVETQLKNSEERHRQIIQTSMDGFWITDTQGRILDVNDAYCQLTGYAREELLNMCIADVEAKETPEETAQHIQELMTKGHVRFESRHRRKDGQLLEIEVSTVYQPDSEGGYFFVFLRDITGYKIAAQRIRELTVHLQTVREEEKANIAREIHDDLSGTLTALKMGVYWLASKLPEKVETKQIFDRIKSMSQLLDGAVIATRNIIANLRPTILDDLGLLAAIEWQAAQFHKRTGIECRVNCVEDRGNMDKRQSIALFRIFQEALTNIARHSGASKVEIEFHHSEEGITLFISDNGRGMAQQRGAAQGSYGLLGMTERAEQLGGKINFDSPPGGGFNVTVILPLQAGLQDGGKA